MARVEIYGSSVEYVDQGSGEPVVLLHSSGSSFAQWRALVEQLSTRYRVIALGRHSCFLCMGRRLLSSRSSARSSEAQRGSGQASMPGLSSV